MPVPNWLVKSLAWAFVASMLGGAAYIQAQVDAQEKVNTAQEVKLSETVIHFQYIKESLTRIENKLDTELEK